MGKRWVAGEASEWLVHPKNRLDKQYHHVRACKIFNLPTLNHQLIDGKRNWLVNDYVYYICILYCRFFCGFEGPVKRIPGIQFKIKRGLMGSRLISTDEALAMGATVSADLATDQIVRRW